MCILCMHQDHIWLCENDGQERSLMHKLSLPRFILIVNWVTMVCHFFLGLGLGLALGPQKNTVWETLCERVL